MHEIKELKLIGKGSNGEVYLGSFNNMECVVKKAANNRAAIMQLKNEAKVLKYLRDAGFKNAPCFYKEGENELIIERISGRTLDKVFAENTSEADINKLFVRMTDLVAKLHELDHPVIHRDLKPLNIMADKNGELFLIDFGTAKILHDYRRQRITEKGTLLSAGTKKYAAPEQYGGLGDESFTTDIYQLGRIMECIIDNASVSEKYERDVRAIIEKCCMVNPLQRYKNVSQITGDIMKLRPSKKKKISGISRKKMGMAQEYSPKGSFEKGEVFIDIVKTYDTIEFF